MSNKRNGRRRILPMLTVAFALALVMICSVLPAGAFELKADTLRDVQVFFDETEGDLALNRDTLTAFAQDQLMKKHENDPDNFATEKLAELNALLMKEDGTVDFGMLTDLLAASMGGDESLTINALLDVLQKVESADQLIDYVKTQKSYLAGGDAVSYAVEWKLDGVTVATGTYRHMDLFTYPTKQEMNLLSGEYVRWDCGAFFEAPADPAAVTVINGTLTSLARELTELSDGVNAFNSVFKAVIDEDSKQVVLALDVNASNYMDVLNAIFNTESRDEISEEIKSLMYEVAAAGINAGVNTLSINGYEILTVDSYGLNDLVAVLDEVAAGNVGGLVSVQGIEGLLKNEDYTMYRFTHMTPVVVDGVTYESFGDYEFKLDTDGLASDTWTVSLCFEGDTSDLVQVAAWLEETVTVTDIEGGKNFLVDLTDAKMQLILEQAYNSLVTPDTVKGMITRFETPDGDYFYTVNANMTVGQLKDLIRNGDYDDHLGNLTGGAVDVNQREQFRQLLDALMDAIPESWDDDTLADLYDGNHLFAFDGTRDNQWFENLFQRIFGDFSFSVAGRELKASDIISYVFDHMEFYDMYLRLDIYTGDYRLYYYDNGGAVESVFMRPGMDLSVLFSNVEIREGYDIVYFYNGEEITLTPDVDMTADGVMTYGYRAREHQLTVEVTLTDPATGSSETLSKELTVPFGTVLDQAYIKAAVEDMIPAGYKIVSLPADTTMPDSALSVQVSVERIYYTVQWMVDGEIYATTSVAWGELPTVADPTKADDLNYSYTFKSWTPDVVAAYEDTAYTAVFDKTSHYEDLPGVTVTVGKDEENNRITVDVIGPNADGSYEVELPIGAILEALKNDPTLGLDYEHWFGDGYFIQVILTPEEVQHILAQLDEYLAEVGKTYDAVTLRTNMTFTTLDLLPTVLYELIFGVSGDELILGGNDGNTVRINPDALTDPEETYVIYAENAAGELVEIPYEIVGTDENGRPILEFTVPAYGDICVVTESKKYPSEIKPSENGSVTVDPENAAAGEEVTITVVPDEGYIVDQVIVKDKDGNEVEVTPDPDDENKFTYEQPSGGSTVEVTFKKATYDVTFEYYNEKGLLQYVHATVEHGELAEVPEIPTVWKNTQYTFTFVFWDCGDGADYADVTAITSDMTVTARYAETLNSYTVTFLDWDGSVVLETTKPYGTVVTVPTGLTRESTVTTIYTFVGWSPVAEDEITVWGDVTYTAIYSETDRYPTDPDDPNKDQVDVEKDPEDENKVNVDVTDKDGDGEVVIPMGPILEEAEKNPNTSVDITVDFGDGYYAKVEISPEEMQNILDQLDEILAETEKTYDNVDFVVTREETETENGDKAYVYDVTFRVDGEDVDLEGTPGENKITVNVPEAEEGHEYIVEVWDPTANGGEGGFVELPEDQYTVTTDENGETVVEVTTPYYTEIRVVEKIKTFTVIFKDWDGNILSEETYEYGSAVTAPADPTRRGNIYYSYTFAGWTPALVTVTEDAVYTATYTEKKNYEDEEGVTVKKDDDSLDITVDNGEDESEIPFGPVLDEIRNGLNVPLNYRHEFKDGYYLEVVFSETQEQHAKLLAAIEAALAEAGLPLDSEISLYTARAVMTPAEIEAMFGDRFDGYQINAVYKYDITFKVGDTALSVNGLENNIHRVNVDYDAGSDSEFDVVTEDENENIDSEFTEGGDKGGEVSFPTTHYSSFFVVDLSKLYYVSVEESANVTVTVSPSEAVKDSTVTVTVTPAEGYEIVRVWFVNAAGVETDITGGSFTLTEDVTVKAEVKRIQLTVTFKDYDGKTLYEQTVFYGDSAALPADPTREGNAQYTYTFAGWDSEAYKNVKTNVTVTATYTETVNQYTVTFVDYNGNELKKETLAYGAAIVAPADPTRAPSFDTVYTFAGWTPDVAETVTGDVTYTAAYTEKPRNDNEDVTIEKDPEDGSIDVEADAKDPDGDGKEEVEIPGGSILDEIENGLDQPINITVNFKDGYYLKVDILPEDQAAILTTLKAIIEAQGLTNDDVKIIVSREEIAVDGKPAYVYDLTFKVGDVLVSVPGKGANTVTVNVPLTDGGEAAFDAYVKNMDGELEKLESEITGTEDGNAIVTFSIPCYTQIRVVDMTTAETLPPVIDTETSEPGSDTEEPGTETDTEPVPAGCDGSNAWWIILLVVVLLVILGLIGYILYQKGIFSKQIQETLEESAEEEEKPQNESLFIPLGEELPEEEPEEIHIVSEVSVEEVDALMSDATAEHALEESLKLGGTGRLGIINIGVLHDVFESGDTVNLEVLKEKGMIAESIGRLKVLASGSLDKALTVEADAFSVQAIKMITLTGGHAVKLRVNTEAASQNQKKRKK